MLVGSVFRVRSGGAFTVADLQGAGSTGESASKIAQS